MKNFIYWFFDNLFSEPLNSRICGGMIGVVAAYVLFQIIMAAL